MPPWTDPITGAPLTGRALFEAKAQYLLSIMQIYGRLLAKLEDPGIINPETGNTIPGSGTPAAVQTFLKSTVLPALKIRIDNFYNNVMWADPFYT